MRKSVFVLAAVAAMVSGAVMAKDVSNKAMTNAEMDNVVAAGQPYSPGYGTSTACEATGYSQCPSANYNYHAGYHASPGSGQNTR